MTISTDPSTAWSHSGGLSLAAATGHFRKESSIVLDVIDTISFLALKHKTVAHGPTQEETPGVSTR